MQSKLYSAEAALIDREKEATASKEEVMRVEREAENSLRSLKEEMEAMKLKFKTDKQMYIQKTKDLCKTQVEKILLENEKNKQ